MNKWLQDFIWVFKQFPLSYKISHQRTRRVLKKLLPPESVIEISDKFELELWRYLAKSPDI